MFKEVGDHNDGCSLKTRIKYNRAYLALFITNSVFLITSIRVKLNISNHNTKDNKTVHADVPYPADRIVALRPPRPLSHQLSYLLPAPFACLQLLF